MSERARSVGVVRSVDQEFTVLIEGFPSARTATNCWVVAPGDGQQCVVIDPGIDVQAHLDDIIAEHRLHPVAVLLTHGHIDHTFSVVPVCGARDIPAYIHPLDRDQLSDPWSPLGMVPGTPLMGMANLSFAEPSDVRELDDGDHVHLAGLDFLVRSTPGHTRGSIVFDLAEQGGLFSGDLLFAGTIGRTDLPGGSMSQMTTSLRQVILPMADHTTVYPGHGPQTTIGTERRTNPYLRELG